MPAKPVITSVGVELEGGISSSALKELTKEWGEWSDHISVGTDGSVSVPSDRADWHPCIEIRYWSVAIEDVFEFIRNVWDLGFRQNSTCGNHTHWKFSPWWAWKTLTFEKNYRKFIRMFKTAFPLPKYLDRLTNSYCHSTYAGVPEAVAGYGTRYRAINFMSWHRHKTLEIRLLPHAANADELIRAIQKLKGILEECLELPPRDEGTLQMPDRFLMVEHRVDVSVEKPTSTPLEVEVRTPDWVSRSLAELHELNKLRAMVERPSPSIADVVHWIHPPRR
jgi:hypothetical protein